MTPGKTTALKQVPTELVEFEGKKYMKFSDTVYLSIEPTNVTPEDMFRLCLRMTDFCKR